MTAVVITNAAANLAAVLAAAILAALGILQVLVAAGRPYGRLVWGGQHVTLPAKLRIGSALSLVLYLSIALVLAARTADAAPSFVRTTTWVVFGYFVLGVAVNAISRSRPERLVMTPACAVLAACSLALAVS